VLNNSNSNSNNSNNNLVNQEAISDCLSFIDEARKEQFLRLMEGFRIMLDAPIYEDSIAGTSIRAIYGTTIARSGKEPLKFQCIVETSIDFNKTPVDFSSDRTDKNDPIIESYNVLEKDKPTLRRILGLLKRSYFIPQDFSYKTAVEHIHKLREIFSKDEILLFPSIGRSDVNIGLIPI
jgi:hypothetical protein